MKKKFGRLIGLLLAVLMLAGVISASPYSVLADGDEAEPVPYHATGVCGANADAKNAEWYLFDDGTLVIFGTGAIQSYQPNGNDYTAPWFTYDLVHTVMGISKISVEDGITLIGDYDFFMNSAYSFALSLKNVDLPNSLERIGAHAFENQAQLKKVSVPMNVNYIGEEAFKGCNQLEHIDFYCDPSVGTLEWKTCTRFSRKVTCHIRPEFADKLDALNAQYGDRNVVFEANLYVDEGLLDDKTERNIKGYFGQENSGVLGGAAPYIVIGTFSGSKKSVTQGSNGFVSCVRIGNNSDDSKNSYYVHNNNSSRNLNLASRNSLTGIVTSLGDAHPNLKLRINTEYIGTNIVKMIYNLENTGSSSVSDAMLGGTGDIKIGADDYAVIEPLTDSSNEQIGFYMKSGKEYDKGANDQYATLGFIGKNVTISEGKNGADDVVSPDATFFYGKAAANKTESATGAYRLRMIPQRIFDKNDGYNSNNVYDSTAVSHTEGRFPAEGAAPQDSGMSYYWDVGTIDANETKQYAVLFSVYGTDDQHKGQEMVEDMSAKFHTVTWQNSEDDVLLRQVVRYGETPVYRALKDGEAASYTNIPTKSHDDKYDYVFKGWDKDIVPCTGDTVYTAQYDSVPRPFFTGHSLTLDGDIGVYFYIDPPVIDVSKDEVKNGTKRIRLDFSWYDKTSSDTVSGAADYDDATGYFKAKCCVAAPEMAYNITAIAYILEDGKDAVATGQSNTYSVRDYGLAIINSNAGTYGEKHDLLVDLAKKMLDYGAKGQVMFNRTKDKNGASIPYANAGVDYTMESHVIEGEMPNMSIPSEYNTGLEYYAASVVFLTKTTLRQYYRVTDREAFENLSNYGDFKQNGTLYYLESSDIPAFEIDSPREFNVGGHTFSYSALDFGRKMQGGTKINSDLGTALYWYNDAAKRYFAPTQQ